MIRLKNPRYRRIPCNRIILQASFVINPYWYKSIKQFEINIHLLSIFSKNLLKYLALLLIINNLVNAFLLSWGCFLESLKVLNFSLNTKEQFAYKSIEILFQHRFNFQNKMFWMWILKFMDPIWKPFKACPFTLLRSYRWVFQFFLEFSCAITITSWKVWIILLDSSFSKFSCM